MKKNKRLILFLVSVVLLIAIIVGCAPAERKDETPTPKEDTTPNDTTPKIRPQMARPRMKILIKTKILRQKRRRIQLLKICVVRMQRRLPIR